MSTVPGVGLCAKFVCIGDLEKGSALMPGASVTYGNIFVSRIRKKCALVPIV
jgi:hypothetical protein